MIIDEIIYSGGNIVTQEYPGNFSTIAKRFSVQDSTVKNIWRNYCENNTLNPKKKTGGNPSKLKDGDLELIETLIRIRPTISLNELKDDVELYGQKCVSISAISRALTQRMPSGLQYSRKKVNKVAIKRFTAVNMIYTQMFINYLHSKDRVS